MKIERLLLSHGGGGEESFALIKNFFLRYFKNPILENLEDSALISTNLSKLAFTIDGFTVKPIFFKGGDIGKLAVTGTINDLVVMGAKPLYLTAGFIIEEGFKISDLEVVLHSMKSEAEKNHVIIVAGDTKIVPKGEVDGIFITTAGIGEVICEGVSCKNLLPGDLIILSGSIGDHGACILAEREGIGVEIDLKSDCASLLSLLEPLFKVQLKIHAMRDPTRGGLSATLHEWAYNSSVNIVVEEEKIPVRPQVRAFCEAFGFEPYHLACEGRVVIALPEREAYKALEIMRNHPLGKEAQIIGKVIEKSSSPQVFLKTLYGTHRILENTSGELFPRIC